MPIWADFPKRYFTQLSNASCRQIMSVVGKPHRQPGSLGVQAAASWPDCVPVPSKSEVCVSRQISAPR